MDNDNPGPYRYYDLEIENHYRWRIWLALVVSIASKRYDQFEGRFVRGLAQLTDITIKASPWLFPVVMLMINAYIAPWLLDAAVSKNEALFLQVLAYYAVTMVSTARPSYVATNHAMKWVCEGDHPPRISERIAAHVLCVVVLTLAIIGGGMILRLLWSMRSGFLE
jgi:hypothetical protein